MTYSVQWRDPVTGCEASSWHDTEAQADAAADRLFYERRIPSVIAWWPDMPEMAGETRPGGPLRAVEGASGPEAVPTAESA